MNMTDFVYTHGSPTLCLSASVSEGVVCVEGDQCLQYLAHKSSHSSHQWVQSTCVRSRSCCRGAMDPAYEPRAGGQYPVDVTEARRSVLDNPFVMGLLHTITLMKVEAASLADENQRLQRRLAQYETRGHPASIESTPPGGQTLEAATDGSGVHPRSDVVAPTPLSPHVPQEMVGDDNGTSM
eukprot:m.68399 g.68399  ORF g.68399 m.68399 type:complete len:182 (+) comp8506_c0_seq3:362-907(+)